METITQTNRTILFAEINPERLNLLVPFSSHNMYMEDSSKAETTVDFFE